MKNLVINNGTFTANGNLSGYTAMGERVHVHKRQMEAIGLTKQEDLKFPLYVIGEVTTIGQFDANGAVALNPDGTPVTAERLTARSVFKTKEAILQAHVDSKLLDVEIAQAISTEAKTAGLSETAINALLAVVI